jgi:hypothetical protein
MNASTVVYLKLVGFLSSRGYAYVNLMGNVANLSHGDGVHTNPAYMIPTGSVCRRVQRSDDVRRLVDLILKDYDPKTHNDLYIGINQRWGQDYLELYEWISPLDKRNAIITAARYGADRYFKPLANEMVECPDGVYFQRSNSIEDKATDYTVQLENHLHNNHETIQAAVKDFNKNTPNLPF